MADTTAYLLDAVEADKRVLFEGAQGALLDIDHGTFPFVTSSNSSGVGVSAGSGVPGRYITKVIGIVKAYTTRVGGGPFPTEQDNETGEHIRRRGNEYGTVTRRPRRCGWFDAVAARYTARLSGVDVLAVMLLDVLSELAELKICTAYELDGQRTTDFPSHVDDLRQVVPVYETLPGWQQEISGVRRVGDLPANARKYLDRLSELLRRPVEVISVGPDREQTIFAEGILVPTLRVGTHVFDAPRPTVKFAGCVKRTRPWWLVRFTHPTTPSSIAMSGPTDTFDRTAPTSRGSGCRGTSPSSWTATGVGPGSGACRGSKDIAAA